MASRFRGKKDQEGLFSKKNMMSLFIIIIMVLSVLGYVLLQDTDGSYSFKYNDLLFKETQEGYSFKIDGKTYYAKYPPTQVEHIKMDSVIIDKIKNSPMIYVTYDPESKYLETKGMVNFELTQEIPAITGAYISSGLTNKNDYGTTIITCDNSTEQVPVIYLMDSNQTETYSEGGCIIFASSSSADFIFIKQRLEYGLLGVIN